jgi:hypothetical protein
VLFRSELHFFHSGNGDTILIRGDDQWGLVDANFVKSRGVRARVEAKLDGVERLRFVCITHFDLDHIRGLVNFLSERFSEVNSVGKRVWKIDQIICPLFPTTIEMIALLKERVRRADATLLFPKLKEFASEMSKECNQLLDLLCEIVIGKAKSKSILQMPQIVNFSAGVALFGPPSRPNETRMGPWSILALGPCDETRDKYSEQV